MKIFTKKLFLVCSIILVLFAFSCKKKKEDKSLLLLFGTLLLQQNASTECENKTGFVICIPPGLRQ